MPAILDRETIIPVVSTFPDGGEWKGCLASEVLDADRPGRRTWRSFDHLKRVGGVYAFLMPARHFLEQKTIHLHGPKGSKLAFSFSARPLANGLSVLYVGRTSNLRNRLVGHHRVGNRQASGPVKYGLIDCGLCFSQQEAIEFLHKEGTLVWHELSGEENVANRDIIEHSLIANHMPPFNIKAEH